MKPYQFKDGVTLDLEKIVVVEDVKFLDASLNEHGDWFFGEYYYEIIMQWADQKIRRYSGYNNLDTDLDILKQERQDVINRWTTKE